MHLTQSPLHCCSTSQVAFVGFAVQALVSRTGPIEGLTAHLADPFGKNITYYGESLIDNRKESDDSD